MAAPVRPGGVGEIDDTAGIGDELRVAAGAVVVELGERPAVRGDSRIAGGAVVVERDRATVVVGDGGAAGGAVIVELGERAAVHGDGCVGSGAVVVERDRATVVVGDDGVAGGAGVVERQHAAVVVYDDGIAGRTDAVEVEIVVVGEAWRECGTVDDPDAVDVEGNLRATRGEVIGRRAGGEFDRIDRGIVGNRHRSRRTVVGESRRVVGHVRGRAPVGAVRPLGVRAGPGAVDRLCG